MNKEITAEDIINAIDEMFDDEKMQESETFRQGYNYGILKASQYLVHIQQELQRKDNNWNELKEFILNHYIVGHKVQNSSLDMIINKMKELENSGSDE